MRVDFVLPDAPRDERPVVLCIGNFDGVHKGHAALLDVARGRADALGAALAVLTFDPHPRCVVRPDMCPASLTTLDEKRERLAAAGVDHLVVMSFTAEVAKISAADFSARLASAFVLRDIVVGHDFALGHNREGDVGYLTARGAELGYSVTTVGAVRSGDAVVSSSVIRAAIAGGEMAVATELLGRTYTLDGAIEHGEHVGRGLGFPTANFGVAPTKALPQRGIYATWVRVGDAWHEAATNVGYRPTFGGDRLTVEAFLLDFDDDLYGQRLRLAFVERLREERTYAEVTELVDQMHKDVDAVRAILAATPPTDG